MATKTNMERARYEERWFWIACAIVIPFLAFMVFTDAGGKDDYVFGVFLVVSAMAGCTFRGFRALKREIADLKSGDSDDSTATQDSE